MYHVLNWFHHAEVSRRMWHFDARLEELRSFGLSAAMSLRLIDDEAPRQWRQCPSGIARIAHNVDEGGCLEMQEVSLGSRFLKHVEAHITCFSWVSLSLQPRAAHVSSAFKNATFVWDQSPNEFRLSSAWYLRPT
jgi:hypothetical protein